MTQISTLQDTPDVSDPQAIDSFMENSSETLPEQQDICDKLGLVKKSATGKIDLSGEVILERNEGKIYEKLLHEGHGHDLVREENQLLQMLDEIESNSRSMPQQSTENSVSVKTAPSPIGVFLFDTLDPLDTTPSEDADRQEASEQSSDDAEDDGQESEETSDKKSLSVKTLHSRRDTFA